MSSNSFYIRPAKDTDEDIQAILGLIRDLAIYEKAEDSVKATADLLRENLFKTPYAHALLAFTPTQLEVEHTSNSGNLPDRSGEAIGLALYFFNYSTWTGRPGLYLEDLFVKPEHRNKGVGKALFGELGNIAKEKNCGRLDWAVLTWNQPSIDFYEKILGAKRMSEWMGMRLEEDGIENLSRFRISN